MPKLRYKPEIVTPELYKLTTEIADELADEMKQLYGNTMMVKEISEYLRCGKDYANQFIHGLTFVPIGKSKRFRTLDVARKLANIRTRNIA